MFWDIMNIAILADMHDHFTNLYKFLEDIDDKSIECIIHLWDYWAPWLCVKPLFEKWTPVIWIFWNNDWETRGITKFFLEHKESILHRTVFWSEVIWWKRIFMSHFDSLYSSIAKSWDYDLVLYWHDHIRKKEYIWKTLVCNPWAICGNKEAASYAIYDTDTSEITFHIL